MKILKIYMICYIQHIRKKKTAEIQLLILSYFSVFACHEPVNRYARNQILIISDKSAISKLKFLFIFG
jgi:hypothetical protein